MFSPQLVELCLYVFVFSSAISVLGLAYYYSQTPIPKSTSQDKNTSISNSTPGEEASSSITKENETEEMAGFLKGLAEAGVKAKKLEAER